MQVESHMRNEIFAHRYKGEDAKYAILISHGLGGLARHSWQRTFRDAPSSRRLSQ